jgi:hypothetical protein
MKDFRFLQAKIQRIVDDYTGLQPEVAVRVTKLLMDEVLKHDRQYSYYDPASNYGPDSLMRSTKI